jgi:hypothetical protein
VGYVTAYILVVRLKGTDHYGDIGVGVGTILKWM